MNKLGTMLLSLSLVLFFAGCAEEGESGTATVDCGGHGSVHNGHCHCDQGFLYAQETCVEASQITAVCMDHEHEDGDVVEEEDGHEGDEHEAEEHEEHHDACLCPATGECHCESGTVEKIGANSYCVPNLHAD